MLGLVATRAHTSNIVLCRNDIRLGRRVCSNEENCKYSTSNLNHPKTIINPPQPHSPQLNQTHPHATTHLYTTTHHTQINQKIHLKDKHSKHYTKYTRRNKPLTTKKGISTISYRLQKAYRKITTYKPSTYTIGLIAVAIAIFLLGGGIYDLLEQGTVPVAAFTEIGGQGRLLFFYPYPSLNDQFIAESAFIMILYALGTAGLLFAYQSTKYAYKPRQAYITLIAGLVFLILSFMFLEIIFNTRIG
ncbi:MAG: hypothetical protein QXM22_05315 [Candidatus Bathyarchaeia archaeon]